MDVVLSSRAQLEKCDVFSRDDVTVVLNELFRVNENQKHPWICLESTQKHEQKGKGIVPTAGVICVPNVT